jgi:hypothetical protein
MPTVTTTPLVLLAQKGYTGQFHAITGMHLVPSVLISSMHVPREARRASGLAFVEE